MLRRFLATGTAGAVIWLLTPALPVVHPLLIALQATAWIAVVILVLLALPGWRTRGVALLAVLAVLEMPLLRAIPPPPENALRVVAINTLYGRSDGGELVDDITILDPDVVVLAETSRTEAQAVAAATGLDISGPPIKGNGHGVAVLTGDGATVGLQLKAGLHQLPVVDKQGVTVIGVHTVAPVNQRQLTLWRHDFTQLEKATTSTGPLIMAGDFNASTAHPAMKRLGMHDCAPLTPTWPAVAPVLRIDHILVRDAACGASGAFRVAGTDHVGVWADVVLD